MWRLSPERGDADMMETLMTVLTFAILIINLVHLIVTIIDTMKKHKK